MLMGIEGGRGRLDHHHISLAYCFTFFLFFFFNGSSNVPSCESTDLDSSNLLR